mmetsp:Transcript_4086/g.7901  ORF Transcript_4086/g.7901 Transcript_4086/m.7901 type:complete len:306 (-) Transcript_4086:266-1183(-)|eukprot:CAMPEP_0114232840 /NCGR_PEP_ID=MMETSP0058-20121206/4832_1 /TAXON_ID=36894 /ORGANISM="Pyramimonas parkeae, CCMP726" /LENGTH=305 /DNA_ID=CAMNT_0001344363 /DNA_START=30 /DNA_END=947 /DNA_ORIENTATION=-
MASASSVDGPTWHACMHTVWSSSNCTSLFGIGSTASCEHAQAGVGVRRPRRRVYREGDVLMENNDSQALANVCKVPEPPMFDTDEALAVSARAQSVSKARQSLDLRAEREQMEDGNEGTGWVWPKLWFASVAGKKVARRSSLPNTPCASGLESKAPDIADGHSASSRGPATCDTDADIATRHSPETGSSRSRPSRSAHWRRRLAAQGSSRAYSGDEGAGVAGQTARHDPKGWLSRETTTSYKSTTPQEERRGKRLGEVVLPLNVPGTKTSAEDSMGEVNGSKRLQRLAQQANPRLGTSLPNKMAA